MGGYKWFLALENIFQKQGTNWAKTTLFERIWHISENILEKISQKQGTTVPPSLYQVNYMPPNMRGESLEVTMKFVNWKSRKSAMVYIRPDNEDFVLFE